MVPFRQLGKVRVTCITHRDSRGSFEVASGTQMTVELSKGNIIVP